MIDAKKACEIIQKDRTNFRILECEDYGEVFGFNLVTRKWDGNPENLPIGGGSIDTVDKKTGKVGCFYSWEDHPKKIKNVDIYQYLSSEDANFAKRANKALDEYNNSECEVFTL